jgi:hypothetical protein
MSFTIGQTYTRTEISAALGGSKMTYLPQREGRIVCGCFVPIQGKNPNAPEEILAGTGPLVERKAEILCAQEGAIPVFLKWAANQWEYRGEYEVDRCCKGRAYLERKGAEAGRDDLTMVIYLTRAGR